MKNRSSLQAPLRVFTLSLLCLFLLTSCGDSEDEQLQSNVRRSNPLPSEASLSGALPLSIASSRSEFGGSNLVSLSFTADLSLSTSFDVTEAYWAKAATTSIISPALNGCELTGVKVLFRNKTPRAEFSFWGWESANQNACEVFLQKVINEGIFWRLEKVPGMFGEVIRRADFHLAPANS